MGLGEKLKSCPAFVQLPPSSDFGETSRRGKKGKRDYKTTDHGPRTWGEAEKLKEANLGHQ
jgi:hypothetical protein